MREALEETQTRLEERQAECDRIIDMIEDGDLDGDLSPDIGTVGIAILGTISEAISRRISSNNDVIEFHNNKAMNRFIRKEIR